MDQDREDLKEFGDGLGKEERAKLGEAMVKLLGKKRNKDKHGFPAILPKEIVTKKVLKRLFPNEQRAMAFLWAIRDRNETLLEIEEDKNRMAQALRNGSPRKWRKYPELLENIFGLDKQTLEKLQKDMESMLVYEITDPIEYAEMLGNCATNLVDDWITAEITEFKMAKFISDLDGVAEKSKEDLVRGTYLEKVNVSLDKWLISAALFGQANRSLTGKNLMSLFNGKNRNRPVKMLNTMRDVVQRVMKDDDYMIPDRYAEGNWLEVALTVGKKKRTLYFQALASSNSVSSLNENAIRSIGRLSLNSEVNVVFDDAIPGANNMRKEIENAFYCWVRGHRGKTKIDDLLSEFIYRYNTGRRYLLGWKLINPLLRSLLMKVPISPLAEKT